MQNTGYPDVKPFGVVKGKAFMPLVADDGTRNGIDASSLTLEADILAAVNNPDPSKRLYLFNNIMNASAPEADPTFATTDLNERFKTAEGITNVIWEQWGVTEQFYKKVSDQCVSFGEYEIDVCGNLKGQREGDILYPRPVNKNSYNAKFQGTTATTTSMVSFNYDYEYTTNDGDQWQIAAAAFGVNNPLELKSMIDVNLAITVDSATNLTVVASFDYGYANSQTPWTGALLADFTSANITTPAVISIVSVTETATAGTYTIVIPTQTTSDDCTIEAFRAATGVILNGYESATTAFVAL
jgi:hypothetical protein